MNHEAYINKLKYAFALTQKYRCKERSTDRQFLLQCLKYNYVDLIFVWLCITDTNNIDNQLDATITVY